MLARDLPLVVSLLCLVNEDKTGGSIKGCGWT